MPFVLGSAPILDFVSFLETGKAGALNATSYIRMMSHTTPVNIAVTFGLTGRIITTSSACTSGSQGIGYGFETIRAGDADVMICGGSEEFCPTMAMVFDRLYATSAAANEHPDSACRPFDASRDGMVVGEGSGMLILEEREHALARGAKPLAEVVGYATNCDGAHISHPEEETQIRVMKRAMETAGVDAAAIGFINGHGTATVAGDVVESSATNAAYGENVPFHTLRAISAIRSARAAASKLGSDRDAQWRLACPHRQFPAQDLRCKALDYVGAGGPKDRC